MSRPASVQTSRFSLEAIEDEVVILTGGHYRAVLEVGSVDFALKGEVEQEALISGFATFLNSLTFPVQVLVRVLPINIEGYLGELEHRAVHELPDHLAALARDHVAFVRRLARSRALLERRFYLVVPAQEAERSAGPIWLFRRRGRAGPDPAAARRQLTVRCEEVGRHLGRCGLKARRLTDVELARLYHACWCPDLARVQRLRRDVAAYTALVVQAQSRPAAGPAPRPDPHRRLPR